MRYPIPTTYLLFYYKIVSRHSVEILELSVCHETNLISSSNYKKQKYQDICEFGSTLIAHKKITPYFFSNFNSRIHLRYFGLTKAVNILKMPDALKHNIISTVLRSSFTIYCNRNSAHPI